MLKKFFLNVASSFVGAWIALLLIGVVALIAIFGIAGKLALSNQGEVEQVKSGSILKISLDGEIVERETAQAPGITDIMNGEFGGAQALDVLLQGIREGAKNDNIVGMYIECGSLAASPATLDAIRNEIKEFKKSGKKVYAYGDGMGMGAYYVASVADRVYANPMGEINISGLTGTSLFFKGLLDKVGVSFQVVKVGTFKSAVEPYIMESMSEPARAQLDTLYGNMWGYIRNGIAESRKSLTPNLIDSLVSVDNISFAPMEVAMKKGVVDSLIYGREMKSRLAALAGKPEDKLNVIGPGALVTPTFGMEYSGKNRIAVLYAVGEIVDGSDKGINYKTLVPTIVKLADDETVKGMVLRVNSPGGSAFGSAQIGEALDYFQSKGKPLAVSMGDYAASGGYWISSGADIIFADPLTITGSIGIFGLIPNFKGFMDKIGVNVQTVSTNPGANFPNGYEPMDERQLGVMQKYVERGYEDFVGRVAKGRKMSVEAVKKIAEGRVWDARMAQKKGLVDSLGGMQKAVDWVARKADIQTKYTLSNYPEMETNIWTMLASSTRNMAASVIRTAFNGSFESIAREYAAELLQREKIQARMPEISVSFSD